MASTVHVGTGAPLATPTDTLSVPYLVAAALLIGVGTFLTQLWMITGQWVYFPALGLLVIGGLMLLSPRTGPDHA